MERWLGKIALVTGAARGIGAATSKMLAQQGLIVIGCDKDEPELTKIGEHINAQLARDTGMTSQRGFIPITCDLKNEEDIMDMFKKIKCEHGGVSVCISCAGIGHKAPLLEGETWMFRDMFDINVMAGIIVARESIKQMKEQEACGHIIFVGSMAGHRVRGGKTVYNNFNFYNATKFALNAIIQGIRNELHTAKSDIRASMISPGIVQTDFSHRMFPDNTAGIDKLYQSMRCLQPEDIAESVLHMLSRPKHVEVHDLWINGIDE